jgi:hypothetical protein
LVKKRSEKQRALFGGVTAREVDGSMVDVETLSPGRVTGLSVLITPERSAILIDELSAMPCVAAVARETASHAERKHRLEAGA